MNQPSTAVTPNLSASPLSLRWRLIAVSFTALFLELAMIRFVNSTVQVIAYFNNFLIISAFLGLGAGSCLVSRRRNLSLAFPFIFLAFIGLAAYLDRFGFVYESHDNIVWAAQQSRNLPVLPVVVLVFAANVLFFIPLGYMLGKAIADFSYPLEAYTYDLLGSALGVAGFGLMSLLQTPPWAWFSLSSVLLLILLPGRPLWRIAAGLALAGGVALSLLPRDGLWSPYYKVSFNPYQVETEEGPKVVGFCINVDKLRIQDALDFGKTLSQTNLAPWISYYVLPYRLKEPQRVLIMGGGSGNDATVALGAKPASVDVVEIDPVIVSLGKTLHPNRPYLEPNVHAINDDARAYMRRCKGVYDLIIMNALDSHHQLPGLSTLRLESYMYTVESMKDLKRLMAPDGVAVVHLSSTREWMGRRLYWSLKEAFGEPPRLFTTPDSPYGSIAFVYGFPAGQAAPDGVIEIDRSFFEKRERADLATDDWPHLYLAEKNLPDLYLQILAIIVLLAILTLWATGGIRQGSGALHFFLLGAAFMLLETRSITKVALVFGATWVVTALVVFSILALLMAGNIAIGRGLRPPKAVSYVALFASLMAGYLVDIDFVLGMDWWLRVLITGVWIGLPILFAGFIFSESFARQEEPSKVFGANLLGVVIGGALEYGSMAWGLNALYLLAMALYAGALLTDPQLRLFGKSRLVPAS